MSVAAPVVLSRRRTGSRGLLARAVAGVLALALLVYGVVSIRGAEEFTHAKRTPATAVPIVHGSYEDVAFRTSDGLTLRGWFFPAPRASAPTGSAAVAAAAPDRAVIVVHGKDSNRSEGGDRAQHIADFLLPAGYSVLLFDLRGHGASDGDRFSLGQYERLDVAAAVDFLAGRDLAPAHVALLGISMGAGTVLETLLVRSDVGPMIPDSAYTDAGTLVGEQLERETGLPSWFAPGILLASRLFGIDAAQVRPIDAVRAHPERAFLFIQCDADPLVLPHHGRDLRAASGNAGSELWVAPGCGHVQAMDRYPDEYARRVLAFLGANMR